MSKQQLKVNRKWLNRTVKKASARSAYFTGSSPRLIALSIVRNEGMHPSFVGKIDDLLAKLIHEGSYAIVSGQLVRSDNVGTYTLALRKKKQGKLSSQRSKRRASSHGRDDAIDQLAAMLA